jgi:hypothetical protein
MESKNREQRRREKFGNKGGATKEAWPQSNPNPALARPADEEAAAAGAPEPDASPPTSAATGTATDADEKAVNKVVERKAARGSNAKKA